MNYNRKIAPKHQPKYKFKTIKQFKLVEGIYFASDGKHSLLLRVDYFNSTADIVNLFEKNDINSKFVSEVVKFGKTLAARKSKINLVR
jgi:hypothetical protein